MTTVSNAFQQLVNQLTPVIGEREAHATARGLFEDAFGVVHAPADSNALSPEALDLLKGFTSRLLEKDEPLAYITGVAHFYDLILTVNPHVLIPRPETEELVDRMIRDWQPELTSPDRQLFYHRQPLRILDVGTGSGCIAMALAQHLPNTHITGVDVSSQALELANSNAIKYGMDIQFECCDFLEPLQRDSMGTFDVLVSNPPYIALDEMNSLEKRVRDFEPHTALFAPSGDALAFYRATALFAKDWVGVEFSQSANSQRGRIPVAYLETHSETGVQAQEIWKDHGFHTELLPDMAGRDRMLIAYREGKQ